MLTMWCQFMQCCIPFVVFKPEIIRNQFLFEDFVMLKTFIGALASSKFHYNQNHTRFISDMHP